MSLLKGQPLTLGYFKNPTLISIVKSTNHVQRFDGIFVFSSSMAQYAENLPGIPKIMHFCDLDSQKWSSLAQSSRGFLRWVYQREARLLLEYERKIAASFDASCVVSSSEAALFQKLIPGVHVNVIENGVDVDSFAAFPRKPEGLQVVFVGVMNYEPNVEAVSFFAKNIWGQICTVFPQARFMIVGSKPTRKIRSLARIPGVEVTGYVPDVRPYLASATISVVPLALARGVQNKILEAMAAGVPVLTTPEAAKGLPEGAKQHVFVAERAKDFGPALLELLKSPSALEQKGNAAQEFVRNNCTWGIKLRALDKLLEEIQIPRITQEQ